MAIKTEIPAHSLLYGRKSVDYSDCFKASFYDPEDKVDALVATKAFFSAAPKWVGHLFALRNKMVSVFGLKSSDGPKTRAEILDNFNGDVGEKLGLFKVFGKNEQELILGEDDKHLDFRFSILIEKISAEKKMLFVPTVVTYNNFFGKAYFFIVKPFHKLIVPVMMKGIIKAIEKESKVAE